MLLHGGGVLLHGGTMLLHGQGLSWVQTSCRHDLHQGLKLCLQVLDLSVEGSGERGDGQDLCLYWIGKRAKTGF